MNAPGISVLILTKNEQHDLPATLASVAWSDDIHIFDSHSSDATVDGDGLQLNQGLTVSTTISSGKRRTRRL